MAQEEAQDEILQLMKPIADIQNLKVVVKCLDLLDDSDDNAAAKAQKDFILDMLATDSKTKSIRKWRERGSTIFPVTTPDIDRFPLRIPTSKPIHELKNKLTPNKTLRTLAEAITRVIDKIEKSNLDDNDDKAQIEPELVAGLSQFTQGWKLDDFLEKKTQIFAKESDVNAQSTSKLLAQFYLQVRAACTSLEDEDGAVPRISVLSLPDIIPRATFTTIQRYMKSAYMPLAQRVKEAGKEARQDLYTMMLISLGTVEGGANGGQWREMDDQKSGGMDIIDHIWVDIDRLLQDGFGFYFVLKMMLGSIDSSFDRASDPKNKLNNGYYGVGAGRFPITKAGMERCSCQVLPKQSRILDDITAVPASHQDEPTDQKSPPILRATLFGLLSRDE